MVGDERTSGYGCGPFCSRVERSRPILYVHSLLYVMSSQPSAHCLQYNAHCMLAIATFSHVLGFVCYLLLLSSNTIDFVLAQTGTYLYHSSRWQLTQLRYPPSFSCDLHGHSDGACNIRSSTQQKLCFIMHYTISLGDESLNHRQSQRSSTDFSLAFTHSSDFITHL